MIIIAVVSVIPSFATDKSTSSVRNDKAIYSNSIYYLTEDDITNNNIIKKDGKSTYASAITGQVWVKSYAKYSKQTGVSVYTELYVPFYYFSNPKFTIMSGTVKVKFNSKTTTKTFTKTAKSTSTISKTVNTGVKGSAGTKGTVNVFGIASGYNIATGAGAYTVSYNIKIPKS